MIARIYEVDPLQFPRCNGVMWVVAFIIERATIVRILSHLGGGDRPAAAGGGTRPA